jgi:hypothetical protein
MVGGDAEPSFIHPSAPKGWCTAARAKHAASERRPAQAVSCLRRGGFVCYDLSRSLPFSRPKSPSGTGGQIVVTPEGTEYGTVQ